MSSSEAMPASEVLPSPKAQPSPQVLPSPEVLSAPEVVQFVTTLRDRTCQCITELSDQQFILPEIPPMVTNGERLYETNLRLVLRYLKQVNKVCKRQGALDSSITVLQHRAIIKQIHDMDSWPAKTSLPFDIPGGIKEITKEASSAEELRQLLDASWPTSTCTSAGTESTSTSSLLFGTSEPNNKLPAKAFTLRLNRGCEGNTITSRTIVAEGLVSDAPIMDEGIENEQVTTSGIDNTISTEACMKENISVNGSIAFRFQGKGGEITLNRSPTSELRTFRFRHASDSLPTKSHGINNNSHKDNRAVSVPIRCKDLMQSCFLQWSGETLEEFIRGVEVEDVKLDNKVRWLALLQQSDAIAFLGRWPSPATLKGFMQMHHLEWVVRVRGKWDWETRMADAQKCANHNNMRVEATPVICEPIENEPPIECHSDSDVDQDSFDKLWAGDVEGHDENRLLEPAGVDRDAAKDESSSDQLIPGNSDVNESPRDDFVATEPSVAASDTPSWSVAAILAGGATSATIVSVFCPALTAVMLYVGISWVKSKLCR